VLIGLATLGKVGGGWLGARLGALQSREAWAVGFAINSRGATQLVLGVLALKLRLAAERLFVAMVVMSLATSMAAGPLVQRMLKLRARRHFATYLDARTFVANLEGRTADAAIEELARAVADASGLNARAVAEAILQRERTMATGLEHGVAVPHARLPGLRRPLIALGISHSGVDFGCLDGQPTTIVVLTLTPASDDQAQLELLADIARTLRSEPVRNRLLAARRFAEVRAALKQPDVAWE
jgi:mannitol/fructose-specific phosphotransferase system IIA component (Ntr-type)